MQHPKPVLTVQNCMEISAISVKDFSWGRLRHYANVESIQNKIIQRWHLPKNQHINARKQAEEIRFTLLQAKEYFDAAKVVGASTKPLQLYYGCMSLALAEVLWKGSGEERIEKLRANHGSHGLNSAIANPVSVTGLDSLSQIKAHSLPTGTFAIWHHLARPLPIVGIRTTLVNNNSHSRPEIQLADPDVPMKPLNQAVSLLECAQNIPALIQWLGGIGINSHLVRGTVSSTSDPSNPREVTGRMNITVHPGQQQNIVNFMNRIKLDANLVDDIQLLELPSGFSMRVPMNSTWKPRGLSTPCGFSISPKMTMFTFSESLNEFGYLYLALYMAGMVSRYHPEKWMRHLNADSSLALLVEQICRVAEERLPLLTVCAMDQILYLPAAVTESGIG